MKINRFIALTAIALLTIGAMGTISAHAFAQGPSPVVQTSDCSTQDDNTVEAVEVGPDTDNIEEQCGEQVNDGLDDEAEAIQAGSDTDNIEEQIGEQVEDGMPDGAEEADVAEEADSGVQEPAYTGSVSVDQAQTEGLSEADEAVALQGLAAISAAEAEATALAANPGTSVVKTELDNENGALVYSVELSSGLDVKVDVGNGTVLFADSGADSE